MTEVFSGKFVTFVGDSKQGTGKGFFLKGVDGWIDGNGKSDDLKKGDTVKVKLKEAKNGWTLLALKVTEPAKSGGGGGGGGRWSGGGGGAKADPARQQSIVMQHSQEMGVRIVDLLISAEALKMPAVAKREAFILAKLEEHTIRAYNQAIGEGLEAAVAKVAELDEDAGEGLDDEDDDFGDEEEAPKKSAKKAKDEDEEEDFDDDFDDE